LATIPRRLLVVKVHGMGDSVLIRVIIERLRQRFPQMRIGVVVGPATREIMTLNSDFRVHHYSQKELSARSAFASLREIRRVGYDAVLNFEQGSIAGTALIGATGVRIHIGFVPVTGSPKSMFLTHGVRFDDMRSMWDSFIALARIIDPELPETPGTLEIKSQPETIEWVEAWWRTKVGDGREAAVALHLGCGPGMDFKRWPLQRFVELAEIINRRTGRATIILTGTAFEKPLIDEFMRTYRGRAVDASDAGSIERTAAILKRSRLLVSNDTGVMHLGAALGVGTVGLFGPTSPRHWAPIGLRATYVYDTSAACSPCVNNYLNLMPSQCANFDRGRCMRDIGVDAVVAAAQRVSSNGWLG
jgi:heptosyltransferase-2